MNFLVFYKFQQMSDAIQPEYSLNSLNSLINKWFVTYLINFSTVSMEDNLELKREI